MALSTPRGLPVSRLINVEVELAPAAVPFANFGSFLIIGSSDAASGSPHPIDTDERIRSYDDLAGVADDFASDSEEFGCAEAYFSQVPQPSQVYIGRWARTDTNAALVCGVLSASEQGIASWQAITNGSFGISVNATAVVEISGLNFSAAANLDAVAALIDAGLTGNAPANCLWDGSQFVFSTALAGAAASISFLVPGVAGTSIAAKLKGTAATGARAVAGFDNETPLEAVIALDNNRFWHGCTFARTISDSEHTAVAKYLQASATPHVYGITTDDPSALAGNDSTSIGYLLGQENLWRTYAQWSSTSKYAAASYFARFATVNMQGDDTMITMMWKQEPGIAPELLSSSEADALDARNYNYLAEYNNGASIIVGGKMVNGYYFDDLWGADWLANQIQVDLFNLLYQLPKVPQTDAGVHLLVTTTQGACAQGVANGFLAPGIWQSAGFGPLHTGDPLTNGFFVWAPSVALQPPAERNARQAPLIQVAAKSAGAVHRVDVLITVNQ